MLYFMHTMSRVFEHAHPNVSWWRALGMAIGSTLGVGVFGLPYAFAKSGFLLGAIELIIVSSLLGVLSFMFAEVVLQTPGVHRVVGYVDMYLGRFWARVMTVDFTLAVWAAIVAYLIIGASFLHALFLPLVDIPSLFFSGFLLAFVFFLTHNGVRAFARFELPLMLLLFVLFAALLVRAAPEIRLTNLLPLHFDQMFVPYGVLIFALTGFGVVPSLKALLGKRQENRLPHILLLSRVFLGLLYILFALAVVGVTGASTSEMPFEALAPVFGTGFLVFASLLGVVTTLSIFSSLSLQLNEIFSIDLRLPRLLSSLLTFGPPAAVVALGWTDFIRLLQFTGATFGILTMLLLLVVYEVLRRDPVCALRRCLRVPRWVSVLIALTLLAGMGFEWWTVGKG